MKPSQLKAHIKARFQSGIKRTVMIEGSPGVGKTQIVEQVAKELDIGFMVIHAPLLQPEDYGFPVISADRKNVDFVVCRSKFPLEGSDCKETGILLIDELPQCDNSAQKILANFVQTKEIHGQRLKPGWLIVTTGNKVSDRAGANRLLSHLGNRQTRIELEVSLDDWIDWALNNNIKTELMAFLKFKPDNLNRFDAQQDICPTPRAWAEGVNEALSIVSPQSEMEVFKGDVGEGPAAEFCGFLKIFRNLPSVDSILLDPNGIEVPKMPAVLYALCGALAHKTTKDNFSRVMVFVSRMPTEFSVLFIRDVVRRCPEVQTTKDFIVWAAKDGAKLLL